MCIKHLNFQISSLENSYCVYAVGTFKKLTGYLNPEAF